MKRILPVLIIGAASTSWMFSQPAVRTLLYSGTTTLASQELVDQAKGYKEVKIKLETRQAPRRDLDPNAPTEATVATLQFIAENGTVQPCNICELVISGKNHTNTNDLADIKKQLAIDVEKIGLQLKTKAETDAAKAAEEKAAAAALAEAKQKKEEKCEMESPDDRAGELRCLGKQMASGRPEVRESASKRYFTLFERMVKGKNENDREAALEMTETVEDGISKALDKAKTEDEEKALTRIGRRVGTLDGYWRSTIDSQSMLDNYDQIASELSERERSLRRAAQLPENANRRQQILRQADSVQNKLERYRSGILDSELPRMRASWEQNYGGYARSLLDSADYMRPLQRELAYDSMLNPGLAQYERLERLIQESRDVGGFRRGGGFLSNAGLNLDLEESLLANGVRLPPDIGGEFRTGIRLTTDGVTNSSALTQAILDRRNGAYSGSRGLTRNLGNFGLSMPLSGTSPITRAP